MTVLVKITFPPIEKMSILKWHVTLRYFRMHAMKLTQTDLIIFGPYVTHEVDCAAHDSHIQCVISFSQAPDSDLVSYPT